MDINIEKLIKVVKQHRVLYDTNIKEYYDRTKKKQMWEDVCSYLHPAWDEMDANERGLYGKEVQKKWQSLRDCFRRELIIQKIPPQNSLKKKAKYKYFDDLEFLTPFTQSLTTDNADQDGGSNEFDVTKDPLETIKKIKRKAKRSIVESVEEDTVPLKEIKESYPEDGNRRFVDDDEAFLLSLLPGFKEYTIDQKYMLRIELMKTMLRFKESQNTEKVMVSVKCEMGNFECSGSYEN